MPDIIQFGDVFRHNEQYYVWLAQTESAVYTAKILDIDDSKMLIKHKNSLYENAVRKEDLDRPKYSFVELSTECFQKQVAHLANTQGNVQPTVYFDIISQHQLNPADKKNILFEIQSSPNVPITLKELTKDIQSK
jgi:hypothetical protein